MKRTTKIAVTILTISAVAAGTTAIARGGHGNVGDRIVHRVSERLDLNEQQAANLKNLQSEIMETRGLMLGNADADRQTLADLVGAESFDQGAALEMITARTTAMQTQAPELVAAAASFQ